MKNQYFADIRDLFKYDLALSLLCKGGPSSLTLIPMLTPDTKSTHGSKILYKGNHVGIKNRVLAGFLMNCLHEDKRNIVELSGFFRTAGSGCRVFNVYAGNTYFSNAKRKSYFEGIPDSMLGGAVVLLDPDIGIEPLNSHKPSDGHVTYGEICGIYSRMNDNSVLMIFQYIPRVKRKRYFKSMKAALNRNISTNFPVYLVSDNQVVFFILSKSILISEHVRAVTTEYCKRYGLEPYGQRLRYENKGR